MAGLEVNFEDVLRPKSRSTVYYKRLCYVVWCFQVIQCQQGKNNAKLDLDRTERIRVQRAGLPQSE